MKINLPLKKISMPKAGEILPCFWVKEVKEPVNPCRAMGRNSMAILLQAQKEVL
jgi:hypothetical protein